MVVWHNESDGLQMKMSASPKNAQQNMKAALSDLSMRLARLLPQTCCKARLSNLEKMQVAVAWASCCVPALPSDII